MGKVLDVECFSKYFFKCKSQNNGSTFDCQANYSGAIRAIKVSGAKSIFQCSKSCEVPIKYFNSLSGVSKVLTNHYRQETIWNWGKYNVIEWLHKLRDVNKNRLVSDDTTFSGKEFLTKVVIDEFQQYYGNAIRANTNDLQVMQHAV